MVDVGDRDARVLDDSLERLAGAVEQILGDLLELGTGQGLIEEERILVGVDRDVRKVDRRGLSRGQLDLRLLRGFAQTLERHLVLGQVDAVLSLELVDEPVDDALVPVVAAELVVAGGRANLDDALADVEERDVERTATEVEDEDRLVVLVLVEAVGQRGRGRLVDDAEHVEARDLAGVLSRLALGVIEVCGDGNNGVGDILAEVGLRVPLELLQGTGRNLLRRVLLAVDVAGLPLGADVALDGANGPVDVGDGLVLRGLADENLSVLGECDDRRGRAGTLGVGDDLRLATLKYGNHRVRGAEVDTYCTRHIAFLLLIGLSICLVRLCGSCF